MNPFLYDSSARMWSLDAILPWTPFSKSVQPELLAINALSEESSLVALISSPNRDPLGRFGLVGIPSKTTVLDADGRNLEQILFAGNKLQVIALGYEIGRSWVHLPPRAAPEGQPPGLLFEFNNALIVDHHKKQYGIFGSPDSHSERLIQAISQKKTRLIAPCKNPIDLRATVSDDEHARRIKQTKAHIAAGEVYQANIARRLQLSAPLSGIGAVTALSSINPVSNGAYVKWRELELVSNTMETLFNYNPTNRRISSFPIKGTCERIGNETSNSARAQELLTVQKERAEHIMIVDLVRNDLGRISTPGSVKVPRLMGLEGFKGVWHGVSTIEGTLSPNLNITDAIRALFPGGSITGAPKRRSIELIQEIEQQPRGFYTGSIGLIAPNGYTTLSILIRTLVKDASGWGIGVGGGIVWDSVPEREIQETWEKVSVFKAAFGPQAKYSTGSKTANELRSRAASTRSRSEAGSTIS